MRSCHRWLQRLLRDDHLPWSHPPPPAAGGASLAPGLIALPHPLSALLQAYLRLAKVQLAAQDCAAPSASPTGQVPALDTSADLVGGDAAASAHLPPPLAELAAARTLIDYLKHKVGASAIGSAAAAEPGTAAAPSRRPLLGRAACCAAPLAAAARPPPPRCQPSQSPAWPRPAPGQVVNLDRGLTPAQRAEAAAFGSLVEARLQPALVYSTWCALN